MAAHTGIVKQGTGESMVAGVSVGGDKNAGNYGLRMTRLSGFGQLMEISIGVPLQFLPRAFLHMFSTSLSESLPKLLIFCDQVSNPGFGWPRRVNSFAF